MVGPALAAEVVHPAQSRAATEHGILLAPGDCCDVPSHFRLGFAAVGDRFSMALDRFGAFVKSWSAKMVTA